MFVGLMRSEVRACWWWKEEDSRYDDRAALRFSFSFARNNFSIMGGVYILLEFWMATAYLGGKEWKYGYTLIRILGGGGILISSYRFSLLI